MEIDYKNDERLNIINVAVNDGIKIVKPLITGKRVLAICPFCDDTEGHLCLTVEHGTFYNVYKCPRCGEQGTAVHLHAKLRGLATDKEAFKDLMGNTNTNVMAKEIMVKVNLNKVEYKAAMPVEYLDKVYRKFLSMLTLLPAHNDNLLGRGLSQNIIDMNMYKSIPCDNKTKNKICTSLGEIFNLDRVPGFYKNSYGHWDMFNPHGFLIPIMSSEKEIQSMQIRLDNPNEKKRYRFFGSSGFPQENPNGTKADVAIHVSWGKRKEIKRIGITEGGLKADIASYYTGYTWLALPGVNSAQPELISLLKFINPEKIDLAFDMDYMDNPRVQKALTKLKLSLDDEHFNYEMIHWERFYTENPKLKGIDDYLSFLYKLLKA